MAQGSSGFYGDEEDAATLIRPRRQFTAADVLPEGGGDAASTGGRVIAPKLGDAAPRPMDDTAFSRLLDRQPQQGETREEFLARRGEQAAAGLLGPIRPRFRDAATEERALAGERKDVAARETELGRQHEAQQREADRQAKEQARTAAATVRDAEHEAAAQARNQVRAWRDAGVKLRVNPDGTTTPETNADGSLRYEPKTGDWQEQADEQTGEKRYRRELRDERGKTRMQDALADKQFTTDRATGEQYIRANGQRIVLGRDPNIVAQAETREALNEAHYQATQEGYDLVSASQRVRDLASAAKDAEKEAKVQRTKAQAEALLAGQSGLQPDANKLKLLEDAAAQAEKTAADARAQHAAAVKEEEAATQRRNEARAKVLELSRKMNSLRTVAKLGEDPLKVAGVAVPDVPAMVEQAKAQREAVEQQLAAARTKVNVGTLSPDAFDKLRERVEAPVRAAETEAARKLAEWNQLQQAAAAMTQKVDKLVGEQQAGKVDATAVQAAVVKANHDLARGAEVLAGQQMQPDEQGDVPAAAISTAAAGRAVTTGDTYTGAAKVLLDELRGRGVKTVDGVPLNEYLRNLRLGESVQPEDVMEPDELAAIKPARQTLDLNEPIKLTLNATDGSGQDIVLDAAEQLTQEGREARVNVAAQALASNEPGYGPAREEALRGLSADEVTLAKGRATALKVRNIFQEAEQNPKTWRTIWQNFKDDPKKAIVPFYKSGMDLNALYDLYKAGARLEKGEASDEDMIALAQFAAEASRPTEGAVSTGVAELLTNLIPFAGEIYATGGLGFAAEKGILLAGGRVLEKLGSKAGREYLERIVAQKLGRRAAENFVAKTALGKVGELGIRAGTTIAGRGAQAVVAMPLEITGDALQRMTPLPAWTTDDVGRLTQEISKTKEVNGAATAFAKAYAQWAPEVISEFAAPGIGRVTREGRRVLMGLAPAQLKRAVAVGIAGAIVKKVPSLGVARRMLAQANIGGVLEEMGEERIADILRQPLSGSSYFPGMEQLAIEAIGFSAPHLVTAAPIAAVQGAAGALADRRARVQSRDLRAGYTAALDVRRRLEEAVDSPAGLVELNKYLARNGKAQLTQEHARDLLAAQNKLVRGMSRALVTPDLAGVRAVLGEVDPEANAAELHEDLRADTDLAHAALSLGAQMRETVVLPRDDARAQAALARAQRGRTSMDGLAIDQVLGLWGGRKYLGAIARSEAVPEPVVQALQNAGLVSVADTGTPLITPAALPFLDRKLRADVQAQPGEFGVWLPTSGKAVKTAAKVADNLVRHGESIVAEAVKGDEQGAGSEEQGAEREFTATVEASRPGVGKKLPRTVIVKARSAQEAEQQVRARAEKAGEKVERISVSEGGASERGAETNGKRAGKREGKPEAPQETKEAAERKRRVAVIRRALAQALTKGGMREAFRRAGVTVTTSKLDWWRQTLKDLGQKAPWAGVTSWDERGDSNFSAYFDAEQLETQTRGYSDADLAAKVAADVRHELIHAARFVALRERWQRTENAGPWRAFVQAEGDRVWNSLTPEQQRAAQKIYGMGWGGYLAEEHIRQLVELATQGKTSEGFVEWAAEMLKEALAVLKRMLGARNTWPAELEQAVAETETTLAALEARRQPNAIPTTTEAERATAGGATATGARAQPGTGPTGSEPGSSPAPAGETARAAEAETLAATNDVLGGAVERGPAGAQAGSVTVQVFNTDTGEFEQHAMAPAEAVRQLEGALKIWNGVLSCLQRKGRLAA